MTNLELLAPAGSYGMLLAVIEAGADAVYVGGDCFSARAYADNFSKEQLLRAIDYVHLKGKKIYLAVNTLLKEKELDSFGAWLSPYYEAGIDAVIVQDIAVLSAVREHFHGLPVHASTQMGVLSPEGAAFLEGLGVKRAVLARELSLKEIQKIREGTSLELEVFVHGALCYSYSGRCLMSSLIGGRSGNRGRCAQPCRLPYRLSGPDDMISKEAYLLSLKDFCAIGHLPELIQAGAVSFKIEGRMKQADYAAGVVRIYRKYIDYFLELKGDSYNVEPQDIQTLLGCGNRSGFTDRYLTDRNGKGMLSIEKSSHTKHNASKSGNYAAVQNTTQPAEIKEKLAGKLVLKENEPAQFTLQYKNMDVCVQGDVIECAKSNPSSKEEAAAKISAFGTTLFELADLNIKMGQGLFVSGGMLKKLRRNALEKLESQIFAPYRRSLKSGSGQEFPNYEAGTARRKESGQEIHQDLSGKKINISVKITTAGQLEQVLALENCCRIYLREEYWEPLLDQPEQMAAAIETLENAKPGIFLALPDIIRAAAAEDLRKHWPAFLALARDGFLANSYDALGFLQAQHVPPERIILDSSLYVFSNSAGQMFENLGYPLMTAAAELNRNELGMLDLSGCELVIYGRTPVMYTAGCLQKHVFSCSGRNARLSLKDRKGMVFPVHTHCRYCYNIIYNTAPLFLLHHADGLKKLHAAAYRLELLDEDEAQVRQLLNSIKAAFDGKENPIPEQFAGGFTNGHWKRGVE